MQTTRRNFLGAAAGAAGLNAVWTEPAAAKIEPEPWGIKLGIATYTYRKFERGKAIEFIKAVKAPWISIKADQPPKAGENQHLPGLPPEGQPFSRDMIAQIRAAGPLPRSLTYNALNAVTLRGTAGQVAIAERVIQNSKL